MRKCSITIEQREQHIECLFRTYASRIAYEESLGYIIGSLKKGYITYPIYSRLKSLALAEYHRKNA